MRLREPVLIRDTEKMPEHCEREFPDGQYVQAIVRKAST
jgi:hypothetical protein